MVMAQLGGTLVGGVLAEVIGLRGAAFLAPVFALLGAWALFRRPCADPVARAARGPAAVRRPVDVPG